MAKVFTAEEVAQIREQFLAWANGEPPVHTESFEDSNPDRDKPVGALEVGEIMLSPGSLYTKSHVLNNAWLDKEAEIDTVEIRVGSFAMRFRVQRYDPIKIMDRAAEILNKLERMTDSSKQTDSYRETKRHLTWKPSMARPKKPLKSLLRDFDQDVELTEQERYLNRQSLEVAYGET